MSMCYHDQLFIWSLLHYPQGKYFSNRAASILLAPDYGIFIWICDHTLSFLTPPRAFGVNRQQLKNLAFLNIHRCSRKLFRLTTCPSNSCFHLSVGNPLLSPASNKGEHNFQYLRKNICHFLPLLNFDSGHSFPFISKLRWKPTKWSFSFPG